MTVIIWFQLHISIQNWNPEQKDRVPSSIQSDILVLDLSDFTQADHRFPSLLEHGVEPEWLARYNQFDLVNYDLRYKLAKGCKNGQKPNLSWEGY